MGITGKCFWPGDCAGKRRIGADERGFIFSLDLAVALLALLLLSSLMLARLDFEKGQQVHASKEMRLQGKALFIADAMVKSRNEENPLLGSAFFDLEKKRVLQNEIDVRLLSKAAQLQELEFFVSRVSLDSGKGRKTFFASGEGKNCAAFDRLVLAQGALAKVEVVVCEKQ